MDRRKIILLILIPLVIIGVIIFLFLTRVPVEALKVVKQDAIKGVTVTGTVESLHDLSVASQVTARIKDIRFKEGDYVPKDTILALLERKEADGNLVSAKGQLEFSRAQLNELQTGSRPQEIVIAKAQTVEAGENIQVLKQQLAALDVQLQNAVSEEKRFKKLYQAGAVSFQDYENRTFARKQLYENELAVQNQIGAAGARLNQAQQNLNLVIEGSRIEKIQAAKGQVQSANGGIESASARLDNYIVRAPISGYIVQKNLDIGEVASSTAPIFRIVKPQDLYIRVQVEENELLSVANGQTSYIIFDAYPSKTYMGKIFFVSKKVNPITGTFDAKIAISAVTFPVIVGMTSDVTIIINKFDNTMVIPSDYIYTKDKKTYVFKKSGGVAKKAYIKRVEFDNNRSRVISGLKKGDVIVRGLEGKKLKDNTRIKVESYYRD